MATTKLGLPEIASNMTADVPRDLNALAQAIDNKVGVASGLATLGTNGKVPAAQLDVSTLATKTEISTLATKTEVSLLATKTEISVLATKTEVNAKYTKPSTGVPKTDLASDVQVSLGKADSAVQSIPNGSTSVKGIVQLSTSTTSTATDLAATASAVKTAMDRANEAFTSANNGKTAVANAVTAKGVSASSSDTFAVLANKIGQINTGKKWASGTKKSSSTQISFTRNTGNPYSAYSLNVNGLGFTPSTVVVYAVGSAQPAICVSNAEGVPRYQGNIQLEHEGGITFILTGNAYLRSGEFQLPVNQIDYNYFWLAYE